MFDTIRFLTDHYRDPDGVVGIFNAYRIQIPARDTVRKWFERGRVPGDWFGCLVAVQELEHGAAVSLLPYIGDHDAKKSPAN